MPTFKAVVKKNDVIDGEPYTWRRISTVRRQADKNLPSQGGKALSAEPTDYSGESEPRHGETLAAYRADGELHLSGHIIQSSKMKSDERRKKHHHDRRIRQIENAER